MFRCREGSVLREYELSLSHSYINRWTLFVPRFGELSVTHKVPFGFFQIAAALAAAQSYMSVGMAFATSSFLLPQLQDEEGDLKISPEEGSWFGRQLKTPSQIALLPFNKTGFFFD